MRQLQLKEYKGIHHGMLICAVVCTLKYKPVFMVSGTLALTYDKQSLFLFYYEILRIRPTLKITLLLIYLNSLL
jgi:hypothetical protein